MSGATTAFARAAVDFAVPAPVGPFGGLAVASLFVEGPRATAS